MDSKTDKSVQSAWFVFAMTTVALIIGWGLKTSVERGQTRAYEDGKLSARVPLRWLVEQSGEAALSSETGAASTEDASGLVLTTWDPLKPATRYTVRLLPGNAESDLGSAAALQNLQRAQTVTAYRTLTQSLVTLDGRAGYKVTFAYVDASALDQAPVVIQGVDYYFVQASYVVVISLETDGALDSALANFQAFALSITIGE